MNVRRQRGFTLIEMIVSLTLVAILTGIMAVFMQVPFESYITGRNRLELVDGAEVAMRHLDQELRTALPNSVRSMTSGSVHYLEFLATRTDGRYRDINPGGPAGACPGSTNQFSGTGDTCFTTLGQVVNGNQIVVNRDYLFILDPVLTPNPYAVVPLSVITGYTASLGAPVESRLRFTSFPNSPNPTDRRFYVVSGPVSYGCDLSTHRITRYSGYPITTVQAAPPAGATRSVIMDNVASCNLPTYVSSTGVLNAGILNASMTLERILPRTDQSQPLAMMLQIPVRKLP